METELIILKPFSTIDEYKNLVLSEEDLQNFKIVGIFDRVVQ